MCARKPSFAATRIGRLRHVPAERRPRHCHEGAFAAVVLTGSYIEAGDEGRRTVHPGDVLIHRPFESHLNDVSTRGAEVLILAMPADTSLPVFGRCRDPDRVVGLAQADPTAALRELLIQFESRTQEHEDWPDLLARALRTAPSMSLSDWADTMRLRPETVSRGFRRAYGSSPTAYRATVRARAALSQIVATRTSLCDVANSLGFSDQAHMTRAVTRLTGRSPRHFRARREPGQS